MRKQLSTIKRCWTTNFFKTAFKNHPPITFVKASEIIEEMHLAMMNELMNSSQSIELKHTLGSLELKKSKMMKEAFIVDWKRTKERGKLTRQLNHHTSGWIWNIDFKFAHKQRLDIFQFIPLRKHNRELAKRIFNKKIQ